MDPLREIQINRFIERITKKSSSVPTKVQNMRDYSYQFFDDDPQFPPPPKKNVLPKKSQAASTAKLPPKVTIMASTRAPVSTLEKKVAIMQKNPTKVQMRDYSFLFSDDYPTKTNVLPQKSVKPLLKGGKFEESRIKKAAAVVPRLNNSSVSKQPLSRTGEIPESIRNSISAKDSSRIHSSVPIKQPLSRKPTTLPPKFSIIQKPSRKGEFIKKSRNPSPVSILPSKPTSKQNHPLLRKGEILKKQRIPQKVTQSQSESNCSIKKRQRIYESDEDEELESARSEIRKMFRYNPRKYVDIDDDEDDKNMEANFRDIQREEKKSAIIAGKEDREELLKIQEEEKRERLQKAAKKRKIDNTIKKLYADLGLDDDDD